MTSGRVISLNVGKPREIEWLGKTVRTSIWKAPVEGKLPVRGVNIDGDDQSDRLVHGGRDKAVYSYAREDEDWWQEQLGRPLENGTFGENLTLTGVDVTGAVIGERWQIGTALFEVVQPRFPCYKLGARMGDPAFLKEFTNAGRPGAYLRIIQEGEIEAGDTVTVTAKPEHGLTIAEVARIYNSDGADAARLLEAPQLAERLRKWAEKVVGYADAKRGQ